jgi:P4 family phage/plasmid primase-like protien
LYDKNSGIYHKNGEQFLKVIFNSVLGKESTPHRIKDTIELVKIKTFAAITPSAKIAVQNGLLNFETLKLEPFTEFEFVTNKLNAEYKKDVRSEAWEKFIDQICPDDKDLLQEWSGYLLVKGYPFHTIMWLFGPTGRNGKGTWARTMQGILGEDNYSNVSIDEFDGKHKFAVFNLHESLFNICSEPRTDRLLTIEMLQMLSGKDAIDAERKGVQTRFKFTNGAKITVMGNKFPNVDKPTDAFWERLKLCKFPNRFTGRDQVQDLENTWLNDPNQKSGILNWMLEGRQRLLKNHGFSMTKTQEETVIQFKRASDSIGAFIAECLEFNQKEYVPKTALSEHYKLYCEAIGVTPEKDRLFSERIRNTPRIKDSNPYLLGKKTKAWGGIKLKPVPTESGENDDLPESVEQKTLDTPENRTVRTERTTFTPRENVEVEKEVSVQGPNSVLTVLTVLPTRVCGDCGKFHLLSCQFPNGNFETLASDWYAGEMRCFIPKQPEMPNFDEKEGP